MTDLPDPRQARSFHFKRHSFADGVAELVYAFDDGLELIERITFPDAPELPQARQAGFDAALRLLHLVAGISYYKAGAPSRVELDAGAVDTATAELVDALYLHGLAEFAYVNKLEIHERVHLPRGAEAAPARPAQLPSRTLVPIGGGKDSLVAIEALKSVAAEATVVWIGTSPLIAACAARTGLPTLNIGRELSPRLFEMNRAGAYNGHIPVTAVNSAILTVAALLYGFDSIAFANERSASAATLEYEGRQVNHQWSKGFTFEHSLHHYLKQHVATDLDYFSLLRPYSELAITRAFAQLGGDYLDVFSSCNRNFRILGPRPVDRWCGQCPKCHFVFLALAPFMPKPKLLGLFGRNLLDDRNQAGGFDALMEYRDHKPFECVGEATEARAAMAALAQRPEWAEDTLVARFRQEILPQLDASTLEMDPWLQPSSDHLVPVRLHDALGHIGGV